MLGLFKGAMLGYTFDTLDLCLAVFSPLMSFSFLFNGGTLVLAFPILVELILHIYKGD